MLESNKDPKALFNIGYGLYVVTSNDGIKDNGLILNSVMQLTSSPEKIAVSINKLNYSHDVILESREMNINCLTESAPFSIFEHFGFQSGRDTDKFELIFPARSDNGLAVLTEHINSYISLRVDDYTDLGTHGLFICSVTESKVVGEGRTMSYSYYHEKVKPKPKTEGKIKGFVCEICGYIHEADELADDFVCPVCYHGKEDFSPISDS